MCIFSPLQSLQNVFFLPQDNRCLFHIYASGYCAACIKVSSISIENIKTGTCRSALISIYIKSPAALLPPLISSFSRASHRTLIPIISSKNPHRISIYHMSTLTSSFLWGRTSLLDHRMAKERYAIFSRTWPAATGAPALKFLFSFWCQLGASVVLVSRRSSRGARRMYAHRLVACARYCWHSKATRRIMGNRSWCLCAF